jgi:hypothetical protein
MMPNNDLPERFKETEIGPIPVAKDDSSSGGRDDPNTGFQSVR